MSIAVLGLGLIGSIWARNWHDDGLVVRGWNRSPKPEQPGWCPDARTAVTGASVVALVLSDGPTTAAVLDSILDAIPAGAVVCQHATIGVDETQSLRDRCHAAGLRYLDLPFTGSKPAAEQRQTVFFVGDDDGSFAMVEADYARLSSARIACGPVGSAAAMKLSMNLIIAGTYQALAEGLTLARAAGLGDDRFFEVLNRNVARSGLVDLKQQKMREADWAPQFALKHLRKDLDLALALATQLDLHPPACARIAELYAERMEAGDDDLDFSAILRGL